MTNELMFIYTILIAYSTYFVKGHKYWLYLQKCNNYLFSIIANAFFRLDISTLMMYYITYELVPVSHPEK